MSIKDFSEKIKLFSRDLRDRVYSPETGLKIGSDLFIVLLIILVGTASFGLGKLSTYENKRVPISVYNKPDMKVAAVAVSDIGKAAPIVPSVTQIGIVFASKSGTKYYYPSCAGASRIKEENKVWFNTVVDAQASGLTLASGCSK